MKKLLTEMIKMKMNCLKQKRLLKPNNYLTKCMMGLINNIHNRNRFQNKVNK